MVKDIKANEDDICFHDYYLIKISHYNSEISNFRCNGYNLNAYSFISNANRFKGNMQRDSQGSGLVEN